MWICTLTMLECSKVLADNRLGHLACTKDGRPYVVPFSYAYADNHLLRVFPARQEDRLDAIESGWFRSRLLSVSVSQPENGRASSSTADMRNSLIALATRRNGIMPGLY